MDTLEEIMELKTHFKKTLHSELAKLKEMSWKDRIWYIFEYYKVHMFLIVVAGCLIYLIATSLYRQTFTDVLYCAIVNNYGYDSLNTEYLEDGFHEYGGFGEKDIVTMDASMTINYGNRPQEGEENQLNNFFAAGSAEADYASAMKLSALVTSKSLDVVIMDAISMEVFATQGMAADIQTILPEDLYASLSDQIVYGTREDGSTYPCGIRMEGSNLESMGNVHMDDPVFSIIANTPNPDNSVLFLKYLLGR